LFQQQIREAWIRRSHADGVLKPFVVNEHVTSP
jgi:hypothetical protein